MIYALGYSLVCNAIILLVFRRKNTYERGAVLLTMVWPVTLTLGLLSYATHKLGWCTDITTAPSRLPSFGWRRPDDGHPGVAVRGFGFELQMWKARK